MKTLVKKMSKFGILRLQLIVGAIVMVAVMIALPVSIMVTDPSLLLNPYLLGVVIIGILMFGLFAYFLFMRPYILYRSAPEVLAETDGEYLYIHGKKEAMIPLSDIKGANTFVHFPFIYSNELIATLMVYMFSEKYGDLSLEIDGYGSYKLRFVSDVHRTANELLAFIDGVINNS